SSGSSNNGSRTPTPLKKAFAEIQHSTSQFLSPVKIEELESIFMGHYSPFTPETPSKSLIGLNYNMNVSPLFSGDLLLPREESPLKSGKEKRRSAAKKINFGE